MSEVIFDQDGLKVIRFCGRYRFDKDVRTRYELIREFDQVDYLGSARMTLSEAQMKSLLRSGIFPAEEEESSEEPISKDELYNSLGRKVKSGPRDVLQFWLGEEIKKQPGRYESDNSYYVLPEGDLAKIMSVPAYLEWRYENGPQAGPLDKGETTC